MITISVYYKGLAMTSNVRLLFNRPINNFIISRSVHYKLKRIKTPPLKEPMESPYIVGPYLKPAYLPTKYLTEPIKSRDDNDLDYFLYEIEEEIHPNEERTVKLLLLDDVEGLGIAGQLVEAPHRYGASKLIAMRKAEYATEFALKWHKFGEGRSVKSASSALSPRTARLLKAQIFRMPISPNIVIQPWHISLTLRLAGCLCPTDALLTDSIQEYVDENGEKRIKCTIQINKHEEVEVRFAFEKKEESS